MTPGVDDPVVGSHPHRAALRGVRLSWSPDERTARPYDQGPQSAPWAAGPQASPLQATLTGRSGAAAILGIDRREVRLRPRGSTGILRPEAVVQANPASAGSTGRHRLVKHVHRAPEGWQEAPALRTATDRRPAPARQSRSPAPRLRRITVVRHRSRTPRSRPAVRQNARDDPIPVRSVHHAERRAPADDGSLSGSIRPDKHPDAYGGGTRLLQPQRPWRAGPVARRMPRLAQPARTATPAPSPPPPRPSAPAKSPAAVRRPLTQVPDSWFTESPLLPARRQRVGARRFSSSAQKRGALFPERWRLQRLLASSNERDEPPELGILPAAFFPAIRQIGSTIA